jgi:hypothetical protein
MPSATLDRLVGLGCHELCRIFAYAFAPSERPTWFADRLRRNLELLPDHVESHLLAAYVAASDNREDDVIRHLEIAEQHTTETQLVYRAAQALLERFPENPRLRAHVESRLATQPADQPEPGPDRAAPSNVLPPPGFGMPAPSTGVAP